MQPVSPGSHSPSAGAAARPSGHRRTNSGLIEHPPGEAFADQVVRLMRRAARHSLSTNSLDPLAAASQVVADHLQKLVTEETALAATEGAMLIAAEVLGILRSSGVQQQQQRHDVEQQQYPPHPAASAGFNGQDHLLAALGILIPLTYSPALSASSKLLYVDSCLNAVLPLAQSTLAGALIARALEALLESEGGSSGATLSVSCFVARASEPVAALAHGWLFSCPGDAVLSPSDEAQVVTGLQTMRVAVTSAPSVLESIPASLAWCVVLAGHSSYRVRDAASANIQLLLRNAPKDGRAVSLAHAAIARLQTWHRPEGGDHGSKVTISATPPFPSHGAGHAGSAESLDGTTGPADEPAPSPDDGTAAFLAGIFDSMRSSAADLSAIAVVDASVETKLLRDDTVDHALQLLSHICCLRLAEAARREDGTGAEGPATAGTFPDAPPAVLTRRVAPGGLASGDVSISTPPTFSFPSPGHVHLDPNTATNAGNARPAVACDEVLLAALRGMLSIRRAAPSLFRRHLRRDGNGACIADLVKDALHRGFVLDEEKDNVTRSGPLATAQQTSSSSAAPDWFDSAAYHDSRTRAVVARTRFSRHADPTSRQVVKMRRMQYAMLTYVCEAECQRTQSTQMLHRVAMLVIYEFSAWLNWQSEASELLSARTPHTLGTVEAKVVGDGQSPVAAESPREPACCRLAASLTFICRDDPLQPFLADCCHLATLCFAHVTARPSGVPRPRTPATSPGSSLQEFLAIAANASGTLGSLITGNVSAAFVRAVTAPVEDGDVRSIRRAIASVQALGLTTEAALRCLQFLTVAFEEEHATRIVAPTGEFVAHDAMLVGGAHVAYVEAAICAIKCLSADVTSRPSLRRAALSTATAFLKSALLYAASGADTEAGAAGRTRTPLYYPADIVGVLRAAAPAPSSPRDTPPFTYLYSTDADMQTQRDIPDPWLLHTALVAPECVQLLVSLATGQHPVSHASHHKQAALGQYTGSMTDMGVAGLGTTSGGSRPDRAHRDGVGSANRVHEQTAAHDALVLLCRAGTVSPPAVAPALRAQVKAALTVLTTSPDRYHHHYGTAALYADLPPTAAQRAAERTLLELFREGPREIMAAYASGVLHAVAVACGVAPHASSSSALAVEDATKNKVDATSSKTLSHTAIALIAYVTPTITDPKNAEFRACCNALFGLALRDPAPLTVLYCTVALSAISRCIPLGHADGHAVIHFCLAKLRRLGTTPADGTLRRSLLRLAGAIGAGMVRPPRKISKKGDPIFALALGTKGLQPAGLRALAPGSGGAASVPPPASAEDAKLWPGRVVMATLREVLTLHGEAPPMQTRFALRGLCDIVVAVGEHIVHSASSLPPVLDQAIACLRSTCSRLSKPLLDADAHSVLYVAELCVSLLTLLMHTAPWLRGRVGDIAQVFVGAEAISHGSLRLALSRGWIVIAHVAPSIAAEHVGPIAAAQIRTLSLPLRGNVTAVEVHEREAALDVLDSLGHHADVAPTTVARCLLDVAESGVASASVPLPRKPTAEVAAPRGSPRPQPAVGITGGESHVIDLRLRALQSIARFLHTASSSGSERFSVAPLMARALSRMAARFDEPEETIFDVDDTGDSGTASGRSASQTQLGHFHLGSRAACVALLPRESRDALLEALRSDAVGFLAAVVIHTVVTRPGAQGCAVHFPAAVRQTAARAAGLCDPAALAVWPFEPPSRSRSSTSDKGGAAKVVTAVQQGTELEPRLPRSAYVRAVRGSASRGDSDRQQPQWDPNNLVISDPNATDAVPRIAKELAPHSPVVEVRACAEVVDLSPEIARSLFHVIALPYMTEKVTDDVRAIMFRNALTLARGTQIVAQQDARLLLAAFAFAEHEKTQFHQHSRRQATAPQYASGYGASGRRGSASHGHVVSRGAAPKLPTAWAEAPLLNLCEAALRVSDVPSATVLAEAALQQTLQQIRGDDRVSWVIHRGAMAFISRDASPQSASGTPNAGSPQRMHGASPPPQNAPSHHQTAAAATAITNLADVCTMLLRVTSLQSQSGASDGLVEALSKLLESASAGNNFVSLIVPPAVFQALGMHGRALEAFDRISVPTQRLAAGKAKSLVAMGQLRDCIDHCRAAIRRMDDGMLGSSIASPAMATPARGGQGGGRWGSMESLHTPVAGHATAAATPTTASSAAPAAAGGGSTAAAAAAAAGGATSLSALDQLLDDPGALDDMPPRDTLCDLAAFSAWSLGEWDEMAAVLETWTSAPSSPVRASTTVATPLSDTPAGAQMHEHVDTSANSGPLRRRLYYEAVLDLARGSVGNAVKRIQRCWHLAADGSPSFAAATSSTTGLAYATADLQHLAELEEVAVVMEDPSLQAIAQRHWLWRLDAMSSANTIKSGLTHQWQRSLAVLSLALPSSGHNDPFLKLVRVARKQGEIDLAQTAMRRIMVHSVHPDVLQHTAEFIGRGVVPAKILLTVAKCHVEFTGDASLAATFVLQSLHHWAPTMLEKLASPVDARMLSKCFRKLAKWEERTAGPDAIRDPTTRIAVSAHHYHAVALNAGYSKTWKRWAVHNLKVAKLLYPWAVLAQPNGDDDEGKRRALLAVTAHIHCALRGFITVLEINGASSKIENNLNACNIIFDYGNVCSVSRALDSVPFRVPVACWSAVVPQLVTRVLDTRPRVRRVVHEVLLRLGCKSPHAVLLPLLATRQACCTQAADTSRSATARAASAAGQAAVESLLDGVRASPGGDLVVVQAATLVAGLNYLSVLTIEQHYFGIVQAINSRRSSADDPRLVAALEVILKAGQGGALPFDEDAVSTASLPIVRPLTAFTTDRHARHCNESLERLWTACHYALGRYRMDAARIGREREQRPPRPDPREMARDLHAMYEDGAPRPGMEAAAQALRTELAAAEQAVQQDKREDYDRLVNLVRPFRELAAAMDKYLQQVRAVDAREVHPQLAVADAYSAMTMPGEVHDGAPRIASFDPRLHVMKSQQRPKQLRIVSSAGETRMYLLKGREDQRQDERVMQLFHFVNDYLAKGDNGGATLHRFAVVPLSHTAGIIQWVPDAPTFGSIIREHRGGNVDPKLTHPEREILNDVLCSYADYDRLTMQQKVDTFQTLVSSTDCTDFRRCMRLSSRSPDQYLSSRREFVDSLATTSMVGYMLGLGDRHPNNFLIRQTDFRVVHIDFGDCFEAAQLRSRIPESVPFRLTRQLTAALDLSGVRGAFRASCEQVVRAMRRHRAGVLALLDSFVHDPTSAVRDGDDGASPQDTETTRRARAAMRRVELKLLGMEGPPTVDIARGAFYAIGSSASLATHRSTEPQLCDCVMKGRCPMPDAYEQTRSSSPPPAAVQPGSFASAVGELTEAEAAVAVQRWWRQQLHRRATVRRPTLRFKPVAVNFEEAIRRSIKSLDPRFPTLMQHEIAERAKTPFHDLWRDHRRAEAASEVSSDGGHITPPSFDYPAKTPMPPAQGANFPAAPHAQQAMMVQHSTTEAAQVRKIIDTSVDESNLARLYSGWFPWW